MFNYQDMYRSFVAPIVTLDKVTEELQFKVQLTLLGQSVCFHSFQLNAKKKKNVKEEESTTHKSQL